MDDGPDIRDLALIGDRRTAALIDRAGTVVWYCPGRFDAPSLSLLGSLLDAQRGGRWELGTPAGTLTGRRYLELSGILESSFAWEGGSMTVTDWMPLGSVSPPGICRRLSPPPTDVELVLSPAPDYGRRPAALDRFAEAVQIAGEHVVYASHPMTMDGDRIRCTVPAGEPGWMLLLDRTVVSPNATRLTGWLEETRSAWRDLAAGTDYHGPFEDAVADSLRALRLLTDEESGGIVAAATTSLPEVIGGARNYDYRYVWLRDAGMIASALVRACSGGDEAKRFLGFICGSDRGPSDERLRPFVGIDGHPAPEEEELPWSGYRDSRPVRIGNGARDQLQLDAYGNVLLAAKLLYGREGGERLHWGTIEEVADFLAGHWRQPDYGIWEEREPRQYTASKVIAACGLDAIAEFAVTPDQADRWRQAVAEIRRYVAERCRNRSGAYAVFEGSEHVDVSAALFPVWAYDDADSPAMLATIDAIERDLADGDLIRRHLDQFDASQEGAFLAASLWVAQYWVMRGAFDRVHRIVERTLDAANDLGLFPEEVDPSTGTALGNTPQTFVHAALVGTAIDLRDAEHKR